MRRGHGTNTVVALYDDMDTAHHVVRELRDAGIPNSNISLVAHDVTGEYGRVLKSPAPEGSGAQTGAGVGALVGGIGGLLVGLGALTIPGIGPVIAAGPLGSALSALVGAGVGAVAGGAAGGLLGALVDAGIPEGEAGYYAEGVRRGGALVTVFADDPVVRDRARAIVQSYNPVDVRMRASAWRETGWGGYDPKAKPFSREQMLQERDRWTQHRYGADFDRYGSAWRGHYQTTFARSGYKYEHYEPAYQYGLMLRNDPRYRDWDWARMEPEARLAWERRNPGTWEQIKDAVRYSWESVKAAVRD